METFESIIHEKRLVLVDFFATWCGPCKQMHPVLERLKEEMKDNIRILKMDIDKNERLSATYGIQSVPTLMIFREGQVLWRQSGAIPLSELLKVIKDFKEEC